MFQISFSVVGTCPALDHAHLPPCSFSPVGYLCFFKDFIYLFLEKREEERGGEKHQYVVASHAPYWGPGP